MQPAPTPQRTDSRIEQYATDPDYRAKIKQRNREYYANRTGAAYRNIDVGGIESLGMPRYVPAANAEVLTFSVKEVAEVLDGYNPPSVFRLIREGRLPAMATEAMDVANTRGGGTRNVAVRVYLVEEMRIIASILAAHFRDTKYYRNDHEATRELLFSSIAQHRGE